MLAQITGAYVYLRNLGDDVLAAFIGVDEVSTTPGVNLIPRADSEAGQIDIDWLPRIDTSTGGGVPDANKAVVTDEDGVFSGLLISEVAFTPGIGLTIPIVDGDTGGRLDDDFIPTLGLDKLASQSVGTLLGVPAGAGPLAPLEPLSQAEHEAIIGITATGGTASGVPKANGSGNLDIAWLAGGAVTNAKLATMSAATIKGRQSGGGTGDPENLTAAQVKTILNATATTGTADAIIMANGSGNLAPAWLASGALAPGKITSNGASNQALFVSDFSGDVRWETAAVFPGMPLFKDSTSDMVIPRISGTTFPTSPVDGQFHTRTDMGNTMFVYDSTRAGWLSVWEQTFYCLWAADVTTSVFVSWSPSTNAFTSTFGPIFGFQVKITGIGVYMAASGTCQVGIYRSNSAITSATLSLSSETSKTNDALNSSAVAAGGYLGMKRDSGTIEGPGSGYFTVRRFET